MINIDENESGLLIRDAAKKEVELELNDWKYEDNEYNISRRIHKSISIITKKLIFPPSAVCIENGSWDKWEMFGNESGSRNLKSGKYTIQIETSIKVFVKFDSEITIYREKQGGKVKIVFPKSTSVTLGLRSRLRLPNHSITVKPEVHSMASIFPYLSTAFEVNSPDRSYPSLRTHPPLVQIGEENLVPDEIKNSYHSLGIIFHLPRKIEYLFIAAPLIFYTQSEVVIDDINYPYIELEDLQYRYEFNNLPEFQFDVANILRYTFYLDCLIRNFGEYGAEINELSYLNNIEFDIAKAYNAEPKERLELYFEFPFDRIDTKFPDWHLTSYIKPSIGNFPIVPHLLDRLSSIFLPKSNPVSKGKIITNSLNSAIRGGNSKFQTEILLPEETFGRVNSWFGEGIAINSFKCLPGSFENRFEFFDETDDGIEVIIIRNEESMKEESDHVSDVYSQKAEDFSLNLKIETQIGRNDLAKIIESGSDFIHYIGHCDSGGLRCNDGLLHVEEIRNSSVQTFFLNACGSYKFGKELIRKGSVAGAVTLEEVLDNQARKVGINFSKLLIHGFPITQALDISSRSTIMKNCYMVVGDGTHSLVQAPESYPITVNIQRINSNDKYRVRSELFSSREIGGIYHSYFENDEGPHLFGNNTNDIVSKQQLLEYLNSVDAPVIFEGQLYWSVELFNRLS